MDDDDDDSRSGSGSGRWNHDLFVSFFGQDVRRTFLESLYTALDETRICRIYRDDVNLKRTNDISPNLLKAIKESRISIIAFSAHYAESEWCLEELVQILKCRETDDQKVLPLFYDVNTQHVHQLTATYAHAFAKHEKKHDKDKVDAWRDAVQKAAAIAGIDRDKGSEKAFIANIVEHVVAFIKRKLLAIDQPLVDSSSGVAKVRLLLGMGINDARMIVIWGDEGMGKTTIAKLVYNDILSEFNYFCFLHNVGDRHKSQEDSNGVLTTLQNEILSTLLVTKSYGMGEGTREGKSLIRTTCLTKKVLFVLDGVDDWAQIKALGADHYKSFGKGSRIIITTRHRELFDKLAVHHDDRQLYYEAVRWNPIKSSILFCWHAFGKAEPPDDYDYYQHSNEFVQLAGGVPLALKKLGSYLNGKNKREWKCSLDKFVKAPKGAILRDLHDNEDDKEQRSNYKTTNMVTWLWGGEDGEEWTYQPKGEICKIRITFDRNAIHSIGFSNRGENGHVETWEQFGGTDGKETSQIDDKDLINEKLNGIRGTVDTYNGMQIVTSLSFTTTNHSTFGPFGTEVGASFSMIGDVHQSITGFHGRSSRWLNAIGVILRPFIPKPTSAAGLLQPSISKLISVGSWGSQAPGNKWTYVPKGYISDIFITYEVNAIRSIRFTSKDENNNEDCSMTYGNRMGSRDDKISMDIGNEKLNNISGTFGLESGDKVVTSLSFCTDQGKSYGPYGSARGMSFSLMVKDRGFIGFHGRSSDWLDAIGVYLQPTTNIRIGQWGRQSPGLDWDYLPSRAIHKIVITHDDVIHTIGFTSWDDKGSVDEQTFGWTTGSKSDVVNIDIKYEKLSYISGTTGEKSGYVVITSLTFCTDKGTRFGPFGSERGATFSLPLKNGFMSGFFGRSGNWLDSIGVYVNPN